MFYKHMVKWTSFLVLTLMLFSFVYISSAAKEESETLGLVQNTVNQTNEVDRALDPAMILKIDTEKLSSDKNYVLPFRGTTNVTVDYGNGVVMTYNTPGLKNYVYPVAGVYEIKITGTVEGFGDLNNEFINRRGILKLIEIISFGNLGITDFSNGFIGAENLVKIPSVFPAGVTSTSSMFNGAYRLTTGDVSSWDVSEVTNMSSMFANNQAFNPNVSSWDVSKVTNMSDMFSYARIFNQNITNWNTSSVTNMSKLFFGASAFNQAIGSWDVSSVTTMFEMFRAASNFNQPLNDWDVSNVTNLGGLFRDASKFNQPLDQWDVSKVTDLSHTFNAAVVFNQPIGMWNISNVTTLQSTFTAALVFNQPLNSWDTSKVTNMAGTFFSARLFNLDLDQWDTSNVTHMPTMFNRAFEFNKDITGWDVSKVTNMNEMFIFASKFDQPIGVWDVSSVVNMVDLFRGASVFNQPLNDWNVSNVTNMSGLFHSASKFNQPLDKWDVSKVVNMSFMFNGATEFNQPLDMWNMSNVTNIQAMFASTSAFNQPLNSWDVSKVTMMYDTFSNARVFNYDLDQWNTSNVTNMAGMFNGALVFNSNITTWDTKKVTSMNNMFSNTNLFDQPIGVWDTSGLTNFGLFETFRNAKAFNQNINTWNTTNVQNIGGMFRDAVLFNQPLDQWNTNKFNNLNNTFDGAKAFNQDISGWNTSLVTSMFATFANTDTFNQPIGSWNTTLVSNMANMFDRAVAFNQDISSWNTANVTNMTFMFNAASVFNQPIGSWNTAKVTNFERMFFNAFKFNQPLNTWNTSNVTNMPFMFGSNNNNEPLPEFNQDISAWDFRKVTNMQDFMPRVELSPYHFDKLLQRFLDQTITLQNYWSRNALSFSNTRYSKIGAVLRQQLINDRGWGITVKGPLEVTISVEPATKTIGENDPAYTLKYVNLYKEDTGSAVTGTYTITRAPGELEGSYDVTLAGFENEPFYYVVVQPTSTFTITNPFARTVTFKDLDNNVLSETVFQIGDSLSTLVLPTVTAPLGYVFKEWSIVIPSVMPDDYLVITPVFVEGVFKLTFVVEGVDNLVYDLAYLASITLPSDPTRTGYTFKAWDKTIPTTMPSEDVTITALFDINTYTIQFNSNLGSAVDDMDLEYNQSISNVLSPTRTGYTFGGWSPALPTTMPAENLSVEALWTINSYDVTFDTAGGNAIQPLSVEFNDTFTLPTPTRTGYTFKGFVETKPETMPAENLTFTATWDINTYTITFNTNGGTTLAPITLDFGSAITAPSNPTRVGYTFKAWSTAIPQTMPAENVTISATWDINRYTITFNTNGGTTINPITLDFGSTIPSVNTPTREGYIFNKFSIDIPQTMPAENLAISVSWILINVVKDDDLNVEVDGLFDAIPEELKTNDDISVSLVVELKEEEELNQSQLLIQSQLESNQQAQFLDIYVLLTTNQVEIRVSELTKMITVSLVLPEALQGFEGYKIVSVHNGVYRELETTFDETTQTVTFVTDKFSSYAIVYEVITTGPLTLSIILGISLLLLFIAFKRDRKDKDHKNKKSISDVISNTEVYEEDEVKVLSRRKK